MSPLDCQHSRTMCSTATNSSAAHKQNLRGHNVLPPPSSNNITQHCAAAQLLPLLFAGTAAAGEGTTVRCTTQPPQPIPATHPVKALLIECFLPIDKAPIVHCQQSDTALLLLKIAQGSCTHSQLWVQVPMSQQALQKHTIPGGRATCQIEARQSIMRPHCHHRMALRTALTPMKAYGCGEKGLCKSAECINSLPTPPTTQSMHSWNTSGTACNLLSLTAPKPAAGATHLHCYIHMLAAACTLQGHFWNGQQSYNPTLPAVDSLL